MRQWDLHRLIVRTANWLNGILYVYREIQYNGLSYFLKDNSGLSLLSGETVSVFSGVFGCLFCAGVELRFLGGIAKSTYFTKKSEVKILEMCCLPFGDRFDVWSLKPCTRVPWQQCNHRHFLKPSSAVRSMCVIGSHRRVLLSRSRKQLHPAPSEPQLFPALQTSSNNWDHWHHLANRSVYCWDKLSTECNRFASR